MYNKLTLLQENRPFFLSSLFFFILILIYTYFVSDPVFRFYEIEGYDDSFKDLDKVGVFSALLIAPVLEEFIFRGYLTGYRKHFLFIIPQIIIVFILLYDYFILILLFSALLIFLFYYDKRRSENLISNQLLYFSIFFTSILFSLIHYKNFQIDSLNFSLTLSLLAFLPGALFLAYVRYKKGLVYSVLVHFLFNLLTLTINGIIY
jgi:membrane protease YdiL (CAAX protease family)